MNSQHFSARLRHWNVLLMKRFGGETVIIYVIKCQLHSRRHMSRPREMASHESEKFPEFFHFIKNEKK